MHMEFHRFCQLDPKSQTLEDQALLMQTKAEPICHCELTQTVLSIKYVGADNI